MASRAIVRALQRATASLDRLQVELHGHYSVSRLRDFVAYSQSVSLLRVVGILVLTAIPCTLGIVLVDVMPLQPTSTALADQTAAYWARTLYSGFVVTGTALLQWHHASPSLQIRLWRIAAAAFVNATGTAIVILSLHLLIGFPTPFLYQVSSAPWQMMLGAAFWVLCRATIRTNPSVREDLLRFLYLWMAEVTMIVVYPVLNYVFRSLDGQYQTIFSMGLPLWKLMLKNWCRVGTDRLEDLSPVLVVFNVDVFHALFLASAMQSSSSTTGSNTLIVVMAVDFAQSCVAIMEVYHVCRFIKQLEMQIDVVALKKVTPAPLSHRSTIERADSILESSPQIRENLTMSTTSRQCQHGTTLPVRPIVAPRVKPASSRVYLTAATDKPDQLDLQSQRQPDSSIQKLEETNVAYVQANLKLLHMIEFYMLIEFTEVLIAIVYSIYLLAMAQLPNRQFYFPLKDLTEEQFASTVHHVMKYAALELLSFVLLAVVFDRMLRISTLRQLAFTLEKHCLLVQSLLVLWVFFPTQMTLEHLGCDYTFKFAWLRKHPSTQ